MTNNIDILASIEYERDLCEKLFDRNGVIKLTDLALLSGTLVNNNIEYYIWTKSGDNDNGVVALKVPFEKYNPSQSITNFDAFRRSGTIVPAITSSDVLNDVISKNNNDDNYFEVEYGQYPQYAPDVKLQTELLNALLHGEMSGTGNTYTFDSITSDNNPETFNPIVYDEYEYKGRRFIYYKSKNKYGKNIIYPGIKLKNGMEYDTFEKYWVEVLPVKWLVDKKKKRLICKSCLLSGIPFSDTKEYSGINTFSQTRIKKYMEDYMFKDIIQNVQSYSLNSSLNKTKGINGLSFDKVSEEDIIKGYVESGVAVFLHGKSSEGKSDRVKEIDPTCEIIYLRNETPESLNGKSVYNPSTSEMIDIKPSWLKRLESKCESEPDKLHIVFFDEITNALPSIQGMAFNIVLNKEVNGLWKLPENARIVAAGNDMEESLAANKLAEPLFNRFAHVYIETTPESWLKWAIKNNIHPAIISYIAYRKEKALRTKFTGEKPNADPRKWEMASKVLYQTNKPEMLRALVGSEITNEFVVFCKRKVITLEDVINGNYKNEEVKELNVAEKYATVSGLSYVDEENLVNVRKFTSLLGLEYQALFDSMWAHGDEHRLEKLAELQTTNEELNWSNKLDLGSGDVELTLLSAEDIENGKYNTLKQYGNLAAITDLAIITGGYDSEYDIYRVPDDNSLKGRIGWQYTKTSADSHKLVCCVDEKGKIAKLDINVEYAISVRPVIKSLDIFSKLYPKCRQGFNGTYEVEFGEYPQYVPSYDIQYELFNAESCNQLLHTGRDYNLCERIFDEYEYKGRKYVKLQSNMIQLSLLSNDTIYGPFDSIWVEVSPITWLVDIETNTLISKRGLLSGVDFCCGVYDGNFEITRMYTYLNRYMKRDMFQSEELFKKQENKNVLKLVKESK